MYKIVSGGVIVAVCDKPRYIAPNPDTGVFVEVPQEEAVGIAVAGTAYNLNGSTAIEGAPDAVAIEVESGELIFGNMERIDSVNTTTGIAFVTMAEKGDIDDVTAGEHAEMFSPWAYPVAYKAGNIRRHGGDLYRCLQDHTSQEDWTPDTAVSLWVRISDPAEEWPEWSQPVGAHDAYAAGDKVTHNGKHWVSDTDGNVWEPGAYGWTEATEE